MSSQGLVNRSGDDHDRCTLSGGVGHELGISVRLATIQGPSFLEIEVLYS